MNHLVERLRGAEMDNADGGEMGGVVLTLAEAADEIERLQKLIGDEKYVRLRAKYDQGQLAFYGQIAEMERACVGRVLTA